MERLGSSVVRPWSNKLEAFLRFAIFEHGEDFEKIISDERFDVFRQIGFTAFWLKLKWREILEENAANARLDRSELHLAEVRKANFDIEEMQNSLYEILGILKFFNPMENYPDDSKLTAMHGLEHQCVKLRDDDKSRFLFEFLTHYNNEQSSHKFVIFMENDSGTTEVEMLLTQRGFLPTCINSLISYEERLIRCNGFKDGRSKILIATDWVGRGFFIESANIIINYDPPGNSEIYFERARLAGRHRNAKAMTFISSSFDTDFIENVASRFEIQIKKLM